MFGSPQNHLGLGVLLIVNLAAFAKTSNGISVQVSDLARVPAATLAQAQTDASRIFRQGGIAVDWESYQVSQPAPGSVRLIISILPHATAPASSLAMGYAGGVVHATIFWDRIQELAQTAGSADVILGHAIAHEIGHLLMGWEHTQIGVMRPKWNKEDIRMAAQGHLPFTHAQAESLRAIVAQRGNEVGSLANDRVE